MRHFFLETAAIVTLACAGSMSDAASFELYEEGTDTLLGSFEAPDAGGLLTAASIAVGGGIFETLGAAGQTPTYDAVANDVDGSGAAFGYVYNVNVFDTFDISSNPITCGIGECAFQLEGAFGGTPGEWYLDYLPAGGAAIDLGYYEVRAAIVPVPASGLLLLGAVGVLAARRRKS